MKKLKFILLALNFAFCSVSAQKSNFTWAKHFETNSWSVGTSISVDKSGNVYTAGLFTDTCDFDPGLGFAILKTPIYKNANMFLSKLDRWGNFVWAKRFDIPFSSGATLLYERISMAIDEADNVYVSGCFFGTIDFDPDPLVVNNATATNQSVFIIKLNPAGKLNWVKTFTPHSKMSYLTSGALCTDKHCNVYSAGYFKDTADFDPSPASKYLLATNSGGYLCKLDSAGNFKTARRFGETSGGSNEIHSIYVDANKNILLGGNFYVDVDMDPGPGVFKLTGGFSQDVFITKLDSNANFLWAKGWGGSENDLMNAITKDSKGNIYVTGFLNSTSIDLDPGADTFLWTTLDQSTFLSKFNDTGKFLWSKTIEGANNHTVSIFQDNKIYIGGSFTKTVDFDAGPGIFKATSKGFNDMFISLSDSNGTFNGVATIGGFIRDTFTALAVSKSDEILSTGGFTGYASSTVDFDPGPGVFNMMAKSGASECFVHKMNMCYINKTISKVLNKLTSNETSSTYQWVECPSYNIIPGATSKTFVATKSGKYALILSNGATCTDTSDCIDVSGLGVINDEFKAIAFSVYPNPAYESITIDIAAELNGALATVYNVTGQKVSEIRLHDAQTVLELSPGFYIIRIVKAQFHGVIKVQVLK